MRSRMSGPLNPMFGKPVSEANKKLISDLFRKEVYLYDANTFTLISKFNNHKDLTNELKMSPKTLIKYKDSGKVYKESYIISSRSPEEITFGENKGTDVLESSRIGFPLGAASFPRIRFDRLMTFC